MICARSSMTSPRASGRACCRGQFSQCRRMAPSRRPSTSSGCRKSAKVTGCRVLAWIGQSLSMSMPRSDASVQKAPIGRRDVRHKHLRLFQTRQVRASASLVGAHRTAPCAQVSATSPRRRRSTGTPRTNARAMTVSGSLTSPQVRRFPGCCSVRSFCLAGRSLNAVSACLLICGAKHTTALHCAALLQLQPTQATVVEGRARHQHSHGAPCRA